MSECDHDFGMLGVCVKCGAADARWEDNVLPRIERSEPVTFSAGAGAVADDPLALVRKRLSLVVETTVALTPSEASQLIEAIDAHMRAANSPERDS